MSFGHLEVNQSMSSHTQSTLERQSITLLSLNTNFHHITSHSDHNHTQITLHTVKYVLDIQSTFRTINGLHLLTFHPIERYAQSNGCSRWLVIPLDCYLRFSFQFQFELEVQFRSSFKTIKSQKQNTVITTFLRYIIIVGGHLNNWINHISVRGQIRYYRGCVGEQRQFVFSVSKDKKGRECIGIESTVWIA